jgi:hypothetical protein
VNSADTNRSIQARTIQKRNLDDCTAQAITID